MAYVKSIHMGGPPANEKLQALRVLLAGRAMTEAELRRRAEVSEEAYRQLVHGNQFSRRRCYKIEKALGAPIWTEPKRFSDLRRVAEYLGRDFVLSSFHQLRSAAAAKGVRDTRTLTNKDALLARVLAHLGEAKSNE